MWTWITKTVKDRFQFDLPEGVRTTILRAPLLRNLCHKTGVRVFAKDYDFSVDSPFQIEGINTNFKCPYHCRYCRSLSRNKAFLTQGNSRFLELIFRQTQDGHDLLETGVSYLAQGRLDIAFELLSEALVIFSQVYGPMHQATAVCFR